MKLRLGRGALLWLLALAFTLGIASYQRRTGPTWPAEAEVELDGRRVELELPRSGTTGEPVRVALPALPGSEGGALSWRRYPTDEPWRRVPLRAEGGEWVAELPSQPPAGKVAYRLELEGAGGPVQLPDEPVVLRFKGPVPVAVLLPHVLLMFTAMLLGLRATLEAAAGRPRLRPYTWATLGTLVAGGLVLGPLVQLHAFGQAWTGVPFGWDLTDNKTLLMVLAWLGAAAATGLRGPPRRIARPAVLAAGLLTIALYLVPHSLHGSQLDYEQYERGVPLERAIGQD